MKLPCAGLCCAAVVAGVLGVALAQPRGTSPRSAGTADTVQTAAAAQGLEAARAAGLLAGITVDDAVASHRAGQRAVNGATRAGTGAACFACHGMHGEGDTAGGFPRLAGLPAYYIAKQLGNYADGTRPNAVMTPIAIALSVTERRDIGVYYATLRAPARAALPRSDVTGLQQAATLAAVGSLERGVQACSNCHGPNGIGMPPDTPYLAGQNAPYMELQLRAWQEGTRRNDHLGVMRDVATRLSPEERRAIALYFASLPAPEAMP